MRLLERLQHHRHVLEAVEFALEGENVGGQPLLDDAHASGLARAVGRVDAEKADLDRRHAAPDAHLQAPAAHLVEHADLLDQPQRVVERQEIDQRPEPEPLRALRHGSHEQAGRGGEAQRRAVVLGQMIGVEAVPVVGLGQPHAVLDLLAERHAAVVHVLEDAELHVPSPWPGGRRG
jgi:hypothetical protein